MNPAPDDPDTRARLAATASALPRASTQLTSSGETWPRNAAFAEDDEVVDALQRLQDLERAGGGISRPDFADLLHTTTSPLAKLILVFAWGAPKGGWGAKPQASEIIQLQNREWRTPEATELATLVDAIGFLFDPTRSHPSVEADQPVHPYAFDKLWQPRDRSNPLVKGLRTSYGTKVLYWAVRQHWTTAPAGQPIPLIYDRRVHAALTQLYEQVELFGWARGEGRQTFDSPAGKVRYSSYEAYCAFAHLAAWYLNDICRDDPAVRFLPDDIEYWLFRLAGQSSHTPPPTPAGATAGDMEGEEADQRAEPDADDELNRIHEVLLVLAQSIGSIHVPNREHPGSWFVDP